MLSRPKGRIQICNEIARRHRLTIKGLIDKDKIIKYIYTLTGKLNDLELEPEECRKIATQLEEIVRNLRIKAVEKSVKKFEEVCRKNLILSDALQGVLS